MTHSFLSSFSRLPRTGICSFFVRHFRKTFACSVFSQVKIGKSVSVHASKRLPSCIIISEGTAVSGFAATLQKVRCSPGLRSKKFGTFSSCPRLARAPGTQATMASNVRSFFDQHDDDGDGCIDADELTRVLADLGLKRPANELDMVMRVVWCTLRTSRHGLPRPKALYTTGIAFRAHTMLVLDKLKS